MHSGLHCVLVHKRDRELLSRTARIVGRKEGVQSLCLEAVVRRLPCHPRSHLCSQHLSHSSSHPLTPRTHREIAQRDCRSRRKRRAERAAREQGIVRNGTKEETEEEGGGRDELAEKGEGEEAGMAPDSSQENDSSSKARTKQYILRRPSFPKWPSEPSLADCRP